MWNIHPMAMGFTMGYCTKLTQNTFREYTADYGNRYVHSALMGDPTLRMYPVRPVRAVSLYQSGNNVDLSWQESEDEVAGYHVYRSGSLFSGFTRISGELITGCSYTDTSPPAGNNVYMIRALKLERTGSGTFYNLSQGIFDSIYISVTAAGNETGPPLRIFPNPAISGEIIVDAGSDFQDPVQIQVMDATGAVLFETESMDGQINHHYSISLQGFRTGVYLLIVSDKVHFKTERFVKF
jgi:hypothetical protein